MSADNPAIDVEPIPGSTEQLDRQLEAAAAIIRDHRRFVVASHASPDGDAVGSTLALTLILREMGKEATAFNQNEVPYNLGFLPAADGMVHSLADLDPDYEVLVVLDCSSLERVHPDLRLDATRTRSICMDHHETVEEHFADVFVHHIGASAVGEMLFRLLHTLGHGLTRDVARCLFTSIQTDTGSFRYSNTTSAALMAAGQLIRAGVDVWEISRAVYENHPFGRIQLLAEVLKTLRRSHCGRLAILTVTRDMYERTSTGPAMLDGFINFARGIDGVEVAAQLRELDDARFRVSFRSRGRVDVAKLAEKFGGGGHHNAAGCTVAGSEDEVVQKVSAELEGLLEPCDETP